MHELRRDGRTTVLVGNMPPVDRMPAFLACLPGAVATDVRCQLPIVPPPAVVRELVATYNAAIARVVQGRRRGAGRPVPGPRPHPARPARDGFHPSTAGHRMVRRRVRPCAVQVGPLMLAVTLRGILSHKLRLLLSASAITLGIAFLAGTMVLTDTLRTSVDDLQTTLSGGSDVSVRSGSATGSDVLADVRAPVPADLLTSLRRVPGVESATGSSRGLRPGPGLARPAGRCGCLRRYVDAARRPAAGPPRPGAARNQSRSPSTSTRRTSPPPGRRPGHAADGGAAAAGGAGRAGRLRQGHLSCPARPWWRSTPRRRPVAGDPRQLHRDRRHGRRRRLRQQLRRAVAAELPAAWRR